jgi:hypothetical protein
LGSALGMMRANSMGTLQFGQNGASNWSSVGEIMMSSHPLCVTSQLEVLLRQIPAALTLSPTKSYRSFRERIAAEPSPTRMCLGGKSACGALCRVFPEATNPSWHVNTIAIDMG